MMQHTLTHQLCINLGKFVSKCSTFLFKMRNSNTWRDSRRNSFDQTRTCDERIFSNLVRYFGARRECLHFRPWIENQGTAHQHFPRSRRGDEHDEAPAPYISREKSIYFDKSVCVWGALRELPYKSIADSVEGLRLPAASIVTGWCCCCGKPDEEKSLTLTDQATRTHTHT